MARGRRKNVKKKKYNPKDPVEFAKHEEVIQAYFVLQFNKSAAVRAVYGDIAKNTVGSQIQRIFGKDDVKARVKYLYGQKKTKVMKAEKGDFLDILMRRASVSLSDIVSVDYDEDGKPVAVIVPTDLLDGQVVDEISITPTAFGDRVKVKLPDREKSIELAAKLEKMLSSDTNINTTIINAQNDAANEAYRKRMERIEKEKAAKPDSHSDAGDDGTSATDSDG